MADWSFDCPAAEEAHSAACQWRLGRVQEQLQQANCDAVLLYDPINIRYATDTSNMQVWTLHNQFRYAIVFAAGPTILWEFHNCSHLHTNNGQVNEFRPAINWTFFGTGDRYAERIIAWADDLSAVIRRQCGAGARLAVDILDFDGAQALKERKISVVNGEPLMQRARMIKGRAELQLMRRAMDVCEAGISRLHEELRPGITEQELWAWLHYENIRHGGEWIETRLLASGPRTNPWMQEASDRVMQEGELLCFDTDLIGPFGYCADVSRAWTVGHVAPTAAQRELYRCAYEQIQTNAEQLRPGVSYREFSESAWKIPARFFANRYSFILHGVGMCDEYPGIAHWGADWDEYGSDGVFDAGMMVSVEAYIGEQGGQEGVKLEQQYLITESGAEEFCGFPFNTEWL